MLVGSFEDQSFIRKTTNSSKALRKYLQSLISYCFQLIRLINQWSLWGLIILGLNGQTKWHMLNGSGTNHNKIKLQ
jgi:hypothetical protein